MERARSAPTHNPHFVGAQQTPNGIPTLNVFDPGKVLISEDELQGDSLNKVNGMGEYVSALGVGGNLPLDRPHFTPPSGAISAVITTCHTEPAYLSLLVVGSMM